MWSNFDQIYRQARYEEWCMPTGKPVTIGWIWGYIQGYSLGSDATSRCPFEPGTLAWIDWEIGYQDSIADYNFC